MFDRLIASRNPSAARPPVPSSTVAVLVHAGVCAAAVLATLRPHRVSGAAGPPIVISWPLPSEDASPVNRFDPMPGPVLLAGPALVYPEVLRRTGTVGTVVVQVVIDTVGRAEPASLVLQSSHAGFEDAARAFVLGAVFRPGRAHGRAVRVLVRLPIGFTLTPTR